MKQCDTRVTVYEYGGDYKTSHGFRESWKSQRQVNMNLNPMTCLRDYEVSLN